VGGKDFRVEVAASTQDSPQFFCIGGSEPLRFLPIFSQELGSQTAKPIKEMIGSLVLSKIFSGRSILNLQDDLGTKSYGY
jgi:hypothetical protein